MLAVLPVTTGGSLKSVKQRHPVFIANGANSLLCRAEGQENQYRAARLMHLQAEASVLEAEAATWTLLVHMYARTNKTYPGGRGGQQTSVPTV